MPCLNPIFIKNPTEDPVKLSSPVYSPRLLVPCGKCVECRKRRATDWRNRMQHEVELGHHKNCFFVTLTIDPKNLSNAITDPHTLIRKFCDNYRKKHGKSLRHWFITELGTLNGRLHYHGIVFDLAPHRVKQSIRAAHYELSKCWLYGTIWVDTCTEKSVSYIVKYLHKQQVDPTTNLPFIPKVFVSPGLGKDYCLSPSAYRFHHQVVGGVWYLVSKNGYKMALPRYYKSKLFTEDEIFYHQLEIIQEPPNYVFKNKIYHTEDEYYTMLKKYYNDSVRRGTSSLPTIYSKSNVVGGSVKSINPNSFWAYTANHGHYPTIIYPNL